MANRTYTDKNERLNTIIKTAIAVNIKKTLLTITTASTMAIDQHLGGKINLWISIVSHDGDPITEC